MSNPADRELATLAGGCFWCLEAVYTLLNGVDRVVSGYIGGKVEHPKYDHVCSGTTGHAEAVQISYDPRVITYKDLLDIFFTIHDPTSLNRQGNDAGTQYRSAIFPHGSGQKATAEATISALDESKIWSHPLVTSIEPYTVFYPAEDYHQDYFANNPYQPYCQVVVAPKVAKIRSHFLAKLKK